TRPQIATTRNQRSMTPPTFASFIVQSSIRNSFNGQGLVPVAPAEIILVDAPQKRAIADVQKTGSLTAIPERVLKRFHDQSLLRFLYRLAGRVFQRKKHALRLPAARAR